MIIDDLIKTKKDLLSKMLFKAEEFSEEHITNVKKIMQMPESESLLLWLLFLNKEVKRKHEVNVNYVFMAEGIYKAYMSLLSLKKTDATLESMQLEEYFLDVFGKYFDAVLHQLNVNNSIKEKR